MSADAGSNLPVPLAEPAAVPGGIVCMKCGYSLTGLGPVGTCPECGGSYFIAGEITDDRPCLQCGYSLRGLSEAGACPECGTPVARSLLGNLLVYSSREYVGQLVLGARLVWWSIALAFLSMLGMMLLGFVLAFMLAGGTPGGAPGGGLSTAGLMYLLPAIMLGTTAMGLAGWWLLSSPDPASLGEDKSVGSRKVLRIALIVSATCFVANVVLQFGFGTVGGGFPFFMGGAGGLQGAPTAGAEIWGLALLVGLVGQIVWLVKVFASMVYLRGLASRIPDQKIYRRAEVLIWFGGVLGVILLLVFVAARLAAGTSATGRAPVLMLVVTPAFCGSGVAGLVFFVMYVGLIDRVVKALRTVKRAIDAETNPSAITRGPAA